MEAYCHYHFKLLFLFLIIHSALSEIFFEERFDGDYHLCLFYSFEFELCSWYSGCLLLFCYVCVHLGEWKMGGEGDGWCRIGRGVKAKLEHSSTQPESGLVTLTTKVYSLLRFLTCLLDQACSESVGIKEVFTWLLRVKFVLVIATCEQALVRLCVEFDLYCSSYLLNCYRYSNAQWCQAFCNFCKDTGVQQ